MAQKSSMIIKITKKMTAQRISNILKESWFPIVDEWDLV